MFWNVLECFRMCCNVPMKAPVSEGPHSHRRHLGARHNMFTQTGLAENRGTPNHHPFYRRIFPIVTVMITNHIPIIFPSCSHHKPTNYWGFLMYGTPKKNPGWHPPAALPHLSNTSIKLSSAAIFTKISTALRCLPAVRYLRAFPTWGVPPNAWCF